MLFICSSDIDIVVSKLRSVEGGVLETAVWGLEESEL